MRRVIKLISIFSLSFLSLHASTLEDKIINFEKERFSKNSRIEIKQISINTKKELPMKGWYGFIVDVKATMAGNEVKAKDIVFSNGSLVSSELFDLKTSKSLKDLITPELTSKYYDNSKLIAGSKDAQNKLVLFTDPLCPFCMDFSPDVINYVKKHSDNLALYYYHFPLIRIHPASLPLSKLMVLGKQKGIKDIELKVYTTDWDKYFTSKENDELKVLKAFNTEFKTSFTKIDLDKKSVEQEILHDINMGEDVMVQGTPTIFVNGKLDKTKLKYETLGR